MPMISYKDVLFTPEEAYEAIMLRNAIAAHADTDTPFPDIKEMSETELRHWLGTAVINARHQVKKHVTEDPTR